MTAAAQIDAAQPVELYRLRNSDGDLLYVGISLSASNRMGAHKADKGWWTDVARIDIERFPTRQAAAAAEVAAIRAERPRYNIVHRISPAGEPSHTEMFAELQLAGEHVRECQRLRDESIVQAHDAGMSLRQIADAVGLSHMGVRKIIQRTEGN